MAGFNWKPDVSLGNIITIIALVFSMGVAWSAVNSRVDAQEQKLQELADRFDKETVETAKERIRLTELLTEMRTDIRYLRATVERRASVAPSPTPLPQ